MSNFFESLQRAELIGVEEFPLSPVQSATATVDLPDQYASEQPTATLPKLSVPKRTISLRLSALAPVFPFTEETHIAAEQYRMIRTKVLHHHLQPRTIVVSSASSGDGKTVNSINIASSFALKRDLRIALIDADMRRPQIANLLGIESSPGLGDLLAGTASFEDVAIYPEQFPNLCVVPAGAARNNQAELLDSPRWRALVSTLKTNFDYVLFDAPPIAIVADYELVQQVSDAVIVVARPDHSNRNLCLKALGTVPQKKLLGVVLNCVEDWFLWRTDSYGYYAEAER